MIYDVSHITTYSYTDAVSLSHHLIRLQPRELNRQHCVKADLVIEPRPSVVTSHTDYFGNRVSYVTVEGAHRKLVVSSRSQVNVEPSAPPAPADTPAWEEARSHCQDDYSPETLEAREFVHDSPQVRNLPAFAEYATPSFPADRPVLDAVLDLTARLHKDFTFDAKATTVATPLEQVLKNRRGVCQDFAHLEIGFLRSMGIPARYVSGYLETDPPPGKPRLAGADASHAWVSFFCPGSGWIDVDPTNNLIPSMRHVTVAWGRDYGDVGPIRGVILGSGEHSLKVAVDVIPLHEPRFQWQTNQS